ncbi:hypothetical protein V2A60_008824 [Cordyceps javanica]
MSPPSSQTRPDTKRKKRPRPLPHVNARNLAIEKKRREQMNGNFLDLAHLVPELAHAQRLTKVHIVSQTIEHLREQRELCAAAAREMQALLADNYRLTAEVNLLRSGVPGGPVVTAAAAAAAATAAAPPQDLALGLATRTIPRLLAISQLGSGTATLRDANEGPEPKSKVVAPAPLAGEASTESQLPQGTRVSSSSSSSSSAELGADTSSAQYYADLWNTGYDFTGIPEAHQKHFLWPCSVPNVSPDDSSLLVPTGVPTPPRDGRDRDAATVGMYPTGLLSDDGLYDTGFNDTGLSDIWSGLGIC